MAMMRWCLWSLVLVVLVVCAALQASADELVLKTGERHVGTILEETSTSVKLEMDFGGAKVVMTFPRGEIRQVIKKLTPIEEYAQRVDELADTAMAHEELARWALKHDLKEQAGKHAAAAYKAEPNPRVEALLKKCGLQRDGDDWVTEAEYLERRDRVRIGGRVVDKDEADSVRLKSHALVRRNRAQSDLRVAETAIRRLQAKRDKLAAELTSLYSSLEYLRAAVESKHAERDAQYRRVVAAKTQLDYYANLRSNEEQAYGKASPAAEAACSAAYTAHKQEQAIYNRMNREFNRLARDHNSTLSRLRSRAKTSDETVADLDKALLKQAEANQKLAKANADLERAEAGDSNSSAVQTSGVLPAVRAAVVMLHVTRASGWYSGSGFVVTSGGHVVTNAHVVQGATEVRGIWDRSLGVEPVRFRVVRSDREYDVALLEPVGERSRTWVPLEVVGGGAQGEEVLAVGFPVSDASMSGGRSVSDLVVSRGIISSLQSEVGGRRVYRTDVNASSGSSGGPLLNREGKVVGVIYAGIDPKDREAHGSIWVLAIPGADVLSRLGLGTTGR